MNIEELEARQSELKSRVSELFKERQAGELTDDDREEWDDSNSELEQVRKELDEKLAMRARVEELAEQPENVEQGASFHVRKSDRVSNAEIWDLSTIRSSVSRPQEATRELKDRAKRAVEMAVFPQEEIKREDAQGHIERLLETVDGDRGELSQHILETGSPEYRRAFGKKLLGAHLTPEEDRALGIKEGKLGNFAVPFTLDPTVIPTSNYVVNPLRQIATVKPITGNLWKGVTAGAITAAYALEGAEAGDNAPELGQPEIPANRAQAFVPYSVEVGADWGQLESEMAKLLADAKDVLEATEFYEGTGEAPKPFGLTKGATTLVETATEKAFAIADVYALEQALPPRWRTKGRFLANRAIYNKIRQFDTAGGAGLWHYLGEGLGQEGNAGTLLGYPAHELSTMESAITQAKTILWFGDFSEFVIVERLGMTVELIPHLFGKENVRPTGQRGLYAIWRNGSKVIQAAAFRGLKVK